LTLTRPLVLREIGENNKILRNILLKQAFDFSDAIEKPRKVRIAINVP
jgi:hypothetical protein